MKNSREDTLFWRGLLHFYLQVFEKFSKGVQNIPSSRFWIFQIELKFDPKIRVLYLGTRHNAPNYNNILFCKKTYLSNYDLKQLKIWYRHMFCFHHNVYFILFYFVFKFHKQITQVTLNTEKWCVIRINCLHFLLKHNNYIFV